MTRTGSAKDHQREAWLAALDPGVAPYVDVLDSAGVETYESCEGGDGHSYPEPAVRFYGVRGEGFRALAVALQNGLPVRAIRRLWMVDEDGHPHGPYWEMAFWRGALSDPGSPGSYSGRTGADRPHRRCDVPV